MIRHCKIIAVLALTGGIVSWSPADDDQIKTTADKTTADKTTADKTAIDNTVTDKTAVDKKADKSLPGKKTGKKLDKNHQGVPREERPLLKYMDKLSAEDKASLRELYLQNPQNPEKFRKELRAKIQELRKQENSAQSNMSGIAEKYHKAQATEEKQKYLAQLQETGKKEFYRNLDRSKTELDTLEKRLNNLRQVYENRKNNAGDAANLERGKTALDNLEKRLNNLRQAYESRKSNADKIINDQVEYLTGDPSLHW